jgi:hypothetical protein
MGVYHLMGLGLSIGTVIGPLTYLAHRYKRWNDEDRRFFARSGGVRQRQAGGKVGDVEAIVLFTTREVLKGESEGLPYKYVENEPGKIPPGAENVRGRLEKPMKDVIREWLRREWPAISGGRTTGTIFWCEVDRRDIRTTYERVVRVVAALAGAGGQGKELWANLTGGNNVINAALGLAAMLSGDVARLYYVQAKNEAAEKCVRFTAEDGYWVELPVMPLALDPVSLAVLDLLGQQRLSAENLHSRLLNHKTYWNLVRDIPPKLFQEIHLRRLWKQGLIAEAEDGYVVGPQWELIRPYQELLQEARAAGLTIEALARQEPWLEMEELPLG